MINVAGYKTVEIQKADIRNPDHSLKYSVLNYAIIIRLHFFKYQATLLLDPTSGNFKISPLHQNKSNLKSDIKMQLRRIPGMHFKCLNKRSLNLFCF